MGLLKFLNLIYEVLQLDIPNFKSTGRLISEKDKNMPNLVMPCWTIISSKDHVN